MTWCYKELGTFDLAPLIEMLDHISWRAEYKNPYSVGCFRVLAPDMPEKYRELVGAYAEKYGTMVRCDVRKVPANGEITPHRDEQVKADEHRLHWPLVSHPDIKMSWPEHDLELHLEPGHLYEVNPHQLHTVINPTKVDRVHLMVDVIYLQTASERQRGIKSWQ